MAQTQEASLFILEPDPGRTLKQLSAALNTGVRGKRPFQQKKCLIAIAQVFGAAHAPDACTPVTAFCHS
ncbi:hypothetical protein AWV79_17090 [Cupriavidus sp. UYMMa02A]|nr:hypothetical protein AWV79_17090 [Cupriavidus sp. UYMMa02A]